MIHIQLTNNAPMRKCMIKDMSRKHPAATKRLAATLAITGLLLPLGNAFSAPAITTVPALDTPAPTVSRKDDSAAIAERLHEAMVTNGLISVEQNTGRLLFNPVVEKLQQMAVKQKFLMPSMVVNQTAGLTLVAEIPFSCFLITGGELISEPYQGFRQHETARYLRDVKNFPVSRALICQTVGLAPTRAWGHKLGLNIDEDPFVFKEHVSVVGERFYYFLNVDGAFEMYL